MLKAENRQKIFEVIVPPAAQSPGVGERGASSLFFGGSLARGSINPITAIVPPRTSTVADCWPPPACLSSTHTPTVKQAGGNIGDATSHFPHNTVLQRRLWPQILRIARYKLAFWLVITKFRLLAQPFQSKRSGDNDPVLTNGQPGIHANVQQKKLDRGIKTFIGQFLI